MLVSFARLSLRNRSTSRTFRRDSMPVQQEAPSCQSQGTGFCSVEALRQSLRVFLTTLVPVAANDSVSGEDVFRIVQTLSRWMKTTPAQ